jgi:hypothetical protein
LKFVFGQPDSATKVCARIIGFLEILLVDDTHFMRQQITLLRNTTRMETYRSHENKELRWRVSIDAGGHRLCLERICEANSHEPENQQNQWKYAEK